MIEAEALYTRCPACGVVAPPSSLDYAIAPDGGIDWTRRVEITCMACGTRRAVERGDLIEHTSEATCPRCASTVSHPASAREVCCLGCRLYFAPGERQKT